MDSPKTSEHLFHATARWLWLALCLWVAAQAAQAADVLPESVGARYGLPVNSSASGFKQAEGFANWNLPWRWELGRDWHLQTRLDVSLGWLADARANAIVATAGPSLVLGWRQFPVSLDAGSSPTYLSEPNFVTKNLGLAFEITSHLGLQWDINSHVRASYRYQHMSNAGLSSNNPGLNMHLFGLSYVF